jgi:hypothetical protein
MKYVHRCPVSFDCILSLFWCYSRGKYNNPFFYFLALNNGAPPLSNLYYLSVHFVGLFRKKILRFLNNKGCTVFLSGYCQNFQYLPSEKEAENPFSLDIISVIDL